MIRRAGLADLDALVEIERHSFPRSWARAMWEAELVRASSRIDLLVERGAILAFCAAQLVLDELHIHSIATHPDRRRAGIARVLLAEVLDTARAERCTLAALEVRRSNAPAIALYTRVGFIVISTRRGYYQDNHEDALVMTRALT